MQADLVIKNGWVVTPQETVQGGVAIANEKFVAIGTDDSLPEAREVIDVKGRHILPGLIDAHVHFSQTGWADGRPDALDVRGTHPYDVVEADLKAHPDRYGKSYVCSGVTSVWDVGGYPWTLHLHDRFEHDTRLPHVVAAGPLLSTLDHWLNLPAERQFIHLHDEASARAGVHYLAAEGSKAVKVWYIVRPDLPVEKNAPFVVIAGEEAHKAGLPLIVHATGLAEAKASLRAISLKRSRFRVSREMLTRFSPASFSSFAFWRSRTPLVVIVMSSVGSMASIIATSSSTLTRTSGSPPVRRMVTTPYRSTKRPARR